MTLSLNGDRLREARRFRNLSITELGEKVGVSKQMISKYEHNIAQPSPDVYQRIVLSLQFPLRYFQSHDEFHYYEMGTFYRSRLTSTQSQKKPSEILKKYLAILACFFEDYVDFPILDKFDLSENPVLAAKQLREKWGLKDNPIPSMLNLLEIHGFHIASIRSKSEKIDAFGSPTVVNGKEFYCILIDKDNNTFFRQQFSLAHELGHYVLHANTLNPQELDKEEYRLMEKEANIFASNFLLPENQFLEDIKGQEENLNAYLRLKSKWRVSVASMIYRAKSLGIVSPEQFVKLQKRLSARGWKTKEPYDDLYTVAKPIIMKQAFELLEEADIFSVRSFTELLEENYKVTLPNDILVELLDVPDRKLTNKKAEVVRLRKNKI